MMKTNKNININYVEVNDSNYDAEDMEYPVSYEVSLSFYGEHFDYIFSVEDIKEFLKTRILTCSYCSGCEDLIDSAESFFEKKKDSSEELIEMFKDAWDCWDCDNKYDYIRNLRNK